MPFGGQVVVVAVEGLFGKCEPPGEGMQLGIGHVTDQV